MENQSKKQDTENHAFENWRLGKHWTLFLDRDGVINRRLIGEYVRVIDEFEFIPGTYTAFSLLKIYFSKIFIVTNQQGIGKGLMSESDLLQIHDFMLAEIDKNGGKVDDIFYSPHLKSDPKSTRKPKSDMALAAKRKYPDIHFDNCIMVGDSPTDMDFGKKLGMKTIFIGNPEEIGLSSKEYDYYFYSLLEFAEAVEDFYSRKK